MSASTKDKFANFVTSKQKFNNDHPKFQPQETKFLTLLLVLKKGKIVKHDFKLQR